MSISVKKIHELAKAIVEKIESGHLRKEESIAIISDYAFFPLERGYLCDLLNELNESPTGCKNVLLNFAKATEGRPEKLAGFRGDIFVYCHKKPWTEWGSDLKQVIATGGRCVIMDCAAKRPKFKSDDDPRMKALWRDFGLTIAGYNEAIKSASVTKHYPVLEVQCAIDASFCFAAGKS